MLLKMWKVLMVCSVSVSMIVGSMSGSVIEWKVCYVVVLLMVVVFSRLFGNVFRLVSRMSVMSGVYF